MTNCAIHLFEDEGLSGLSRDCLQCGNMLKLTDLRGLLLISISKQDLCLRKCSLLDIVYCIAVIFSGKLERDLIRQMCFVNSPM